MAFCHLIDILHFVDSGLKAVELRPHNVAQNTGLGTEATDVSSGSERQIGQK